MTHISSGIVARFLLFAILVAVPIDILANVDVDPITECGSNITDCSGADPCLDDFFSPIRVSAIVLLCFEGACLLMCLYTFRQYSKDTWAAGERPRLLHGLCLLVSLGICVSAITQFYFTLDILNERTLSPVLPPNIRQCATQDAVKFYWTTGMAFVISVVYIWISHQFVAFVKFWAQAGSGYGASADSRDAYANEDIVLAGTGRFEQSNNPPPQFGRQQPQQPQQQPQQQTAYGVQQQQSSYGISGDGEVVNIKIAQGGFRFSA